MAAGYSTAELSSPRMRRTALLCLALSGSACEEPATEDLVLQIEDGGGECTDVLLAEVKAISIEVWGTGPNGMCVLGRRCLGDVSLEPPMSTDDIEARISAVNQPLVDVGLEDARSVVILLRTQAFQCVEGPAQACASTDIADADDSTLTLDLSCNDCTALETKQELCP
jgi:hypothetical protein